MWSSRQAAERGSDACVSFPRWDNVDIRLVTINITIISHCSHPHCISTLHKYNFLDKSFSIIKMFMMKNYAAQMLEDAFNLQEHVNWRVYLSRALLSSFLSYYCFKYILKGEWQSPVGLFNQKENKSHSKIHFRFKNLLTILKSYHRIIM